MAAGRIPAPGKQYGPCEGHCAHLDCAHSRSDAATACNLCGKPIGYEKRFYREGDVLSHADCLEDAIEEELRAQRESENAYLNPIEEVNHGR